MLEYIKVRNKNIYEEQFTGDTGPAQMVIAFKNAEEKELRDMRELRKLNMEKKPGADKFCVCRRKFQVQMYHCQLCKDWFVGTDANKFAEFCLLFLKILRIKKSCKARLCYGKSRNSIDSQKNSS